MTQRNSKEYICNYIKDLGSEYISGEYINNSSKLKVKCTDCGEEFETTFKVISRKKDDLVCRKCSFKKTANFRRLKYDDVKTYVESFNCELISKEYKNQNEIMEFKCSCGNKFKTTFDTFKYQEKHQCDECSKKLQHDRQAYSYEYIKTYIENLGSKLLSKTYKNSNSRLKVVCTDCGKIFDTTFKVISKKTSNDLVCKKCGRKKTSEKQIFSYDYIKNYVENESKSNCKLLSKEYNGVVDKLTLQCSCGNTFKTTFSSFKYNNKIRCNKCNKKEKWTIERAKQWVLDNSDCILLEDKIKNVHTNMLFQCYCGNKFKTSLSNFIGRKKRQCNDCSNRSNLEAGCKKYFDEMNVNYIKEKTFDDCRNPNTNHHFRYDFYLPDYNLLIECHGIQHRKPYIAYKGMPMEEAIANFEYQKYRDKYKKDYAKNNKYDLLYIWYYELDNIPEILTTKLKLN